MAQQTYTHTTIRRSEAEFFNALESYIGYCVSCGAEQDQVEPDAGNHRCEDCHGLAVFGAEQCLLRGWIIIQEDES